MSPTSTPPIQGLSLPAADASPLLASFTTFLTLSLHTLLYHRALYPPATFLTARALNLLVRQSRHPGLCAWINDAVAAVAAQLEAGTVRRIAVAMHAPETLKVLERWVFDVETFPVWGSVLPEEEEVAFGDDHDVGVNEEDLELDDEEGVGEDDEDVEMEPEDDDDDADLEDEGPVNWTEVNEALRGALCRISHAAESKPALPKGSTFSLAVELRDDEPPPIGHPQPWIPSRPRRKRRSKSRPGQGAPRGGGIASTTAIRSVHAGPLFFECWMEQAEAS